VRGLHISAAEDKIRILSDDDANPNTNRKQPSRCLPDPEQPCPRFWKGDSILEMAMEFLSLMVRGWTVSK